MKETILSSGIDRRTLLTTSSLLPVAIKTMHRGLPSTERIVEIPNLDRIVRSMVIA